MSNVNERKVPVVAKYAAVANKAASAVQITAEQLLREATDRTNDRAPGASRMIDAEELEGFRTKKRQEFEQKVRVQRHHMSTWVLYASWEGEQREFERARSVFERALAVDYQNTAIWSRYLEMEKKNQHITSLRNLFHRVTRILPMNQRFWLEWVHCEEIVENYAGVRAVFEAWLNARPESAAYRAFSRFEERCGEVERARSILKDMVLAFPGEETVSHFVKFEVKHGLRKDEKMRIADMEASEVERDVIKKRRAFYKDGLSRNERQYDMWIDYLRLEEKYGSSEDVVSGYEEAISHTPLGLEKDLWRRFIYIYLCYAAFLEAEMDDIPACRKVNQQMLIAVPHSKFSFKKVWKYVVDFEIRQGTELSAIRKVWGRAIGSAGRAKPSLFRAYAAMEAELQNADRCREILARWVEVRPTEADAWIAYIELERSLGNFAAAGRVCELAIQTEPLTEKERVWSSYVDVQIASGNLGGSRDVFERIISEGGALETYMEYAQFERENALSPDRAMAVYERGVRAAVVEVEPEWRRKFLVAMVDTCEVGGDEDRLEKARRRLPKVKDEGQLEFPDDLEASAATSGLGLLAKIRALKKRS